MEKAPLAFTRGPLYLQDHKPGSVLCDHLSFLELAFELTAAYPSRVLRVRRADGQPVKIRGTYLALHPVEFTWFHYSTPIRRPGPYILSVALFLLRSLEAVVVNHYGALRCPDFPPPRSLEAAIACPA